MRSETTGIRILFQEIFLLVWLIGCTGVEGDADEVPVTVELPAAFAAQPDVAKIVLRVTAPDIATPITVELTPPIPSSPAFSISVPPGTGRLFEVIASLTTDSRIGFFGRTTSDIFDTATTVSIAMNFVDFAEDATATDVLRDSTIEPDIASVKIFRGACLMFTDAVGITVDFRDDYSNTVDPLRTIIEFDTDGDALTGATKTKIERARFRPPPSTESVPSNFVSGGEKYLQVDISPPALVSVGFTTSDSDGPVDISTTQAVRQFTTGTQILDVCLEVSFFQTQIETTVDPNPGKGAFNVLTGVVDSAGSFQANDIAFQGGVLLYDLSFDTSSL